MSGFVSFVPGDLTWGIFLNLSRVVCLFLMNINLLHNNCLVTCQLGIHDQIVRGHCGHCFLSGYLGNHSGWMQYVSEKVKI